MNNEDYDPNFQYHWVSYSEAARRGRDKTEVDRRRERNQQSTIDDLKKACGVS